MVTAPKKPPDMATSTAVAKPGMTKPTPPWPTQDKVKDLAKLLDYNRADVEAIFNVAEQIGEAPNELARRHAVQKAEGIIELFEVTGGRQGCKRAQKLWEQCHPESWWSEDGGGPAYSQVAKMITLLMGSFPTSKIPEPEIFVRMLLADVMEFYPSFVELESTCRELRKTKTFMPAIAEVIKELEKQQKLWADRENTMTTLDEGYYEDLCQEVAKAKAVPAVIEPPQVTIENRQDVPMAPIKSPDPVEVEEDDDGF